MAENTNTGYTNSVERTIDILEFLATRSRGVSVVELSQEFGVNRTSIYSILKVLTNKGYIRKVSDGRYSLTGRMFEYGQKFRNSFPIVHIVRNLGPSIKLGYDAHLNIAMYFGGTTAMLMNSIDIKTNSNQYVDRTMLSGQPISLHATSLGKLLLAYMPPAESRYLLSQLSYYPYTEHTVRDADALRQQMNEAVANGYAHEMNEYYIGSFCVSAPVFDHTNSVIAACSLSCDTAKNDIDKETVLRDVRRIAKSISTALGYTSQYLF